MELSIERLEELRQIWVESKRTAARPLGKRIAQENIARYDRLLAEAKARAFVDARPRYEVVCVAHESLDCEICG